MGHPTRTRQEVGSIITSYMVTAATLDYIYIGSICTIFENGYKSNWNFYKRNKNINKMHQYAHMQQSREYFFCILYKIRHFPISSKIRLLKWLYLLWFNKKTSVWTQHCSLNKSRIFFNKYPILGKSGTTRHDLWISVQIRILNCHRCQYRYSNDHQNCFLMLF